MPDFDANPTPPGTYDLSTTLVPEAGKPEVGQGAPDLSPDKPETLHDVLADEVNKAKASDEAAAKEAEKPDPKAEKPEAKDAKPDDAKPDQKAEAKAEKPPAKAPDEAKPEAKAEEGEDAHPDAPARFTEEAKRVFRNTPRAVKAEVFRLTQELEQATATHQEATRLHSELREYEGVARNAGTSIKAALDRYTAFDRAIMQDFGKGVAAIAKDMGHAPEATVAQLLRAYGTTPEKYAQLVLRNPQAHQVQPAPQRDPMIAQIAQQNQMLMERLERQEVHQKMTAVQTQVADWSKDKPDYTALQDKVAKIIESGIIETVHGSGLSVVQRLEAAYRMAGGRAGKPDPSAAPADPGPDARNGEPDAGKRSVRGAPTDGLTPKTDDPQETTQDFLRRELRRLRA